MNLTHDRSVQVGLRCGWRALKWAGTAMCVLTAVAFLYSTRRAVIWDSRTLRYEVAVIAGGGAFGWRPEGWRPDDEQYPPDPGWTVAKSAGELEWWPQRTRNKHWESVFLPLWIPLATVMLATGGLWYRDRRHLFMVLRRWRERLCAKERKRLRAVIVIVFTVIHAVTFVAAFIVVVSLADFFFPRVRGVRHAINSVADVAVPLFLWCAPVWGLIWAWLYVRLVNRMLEAVWCRDNRCLTCGYDLTGNMSGRCPECGRNVN